MRQVSHSVEDAKTKWCPFARVLGSGPLPVGHASAFGSVNRADKPLSTSCIADGCMAWRWVETHIANPEDPKADLIASGDTHGLCGLAGQP